MSSDEENSSSSERVSDDVWERLSGNRDALEMCVEEDLPFSDRAEKLLNRLDEEGV